MACTHLLACGLHRNVSKDALRVWQRFYCEGCFERCERFKLACAGVGIPDWLLPNGRLLDGGDPAAPSTARR